MKKLVITGHNSNIVKYFIDIVNKNENIEIIKCGRCQNSDIFVDFNSLSSTSNFIEKINKLDPSHFLICHGVLLGKKIKDISELEYKNSVAVNMSSIIFILEALTEMRSVNSLVVSSISGKKGSYDNLYAASKAGVDLSVNTISKQLDSGSRLNAVAPGIISDSKMTLQRKDVKNLEKILDSIPTKKFSSAIEVAELIYFVMFKTINVNGSIIDINGGHY